MTDAPASPAATAPPATGPAAALATAVQPLRAGWQTLAPRERLLVQLAAALTGFALLWWVALAPAWRTLREAPAQLDQLEQQLQQMQALAGEARSLRAVAPIPTAQAQQALSAATERLGGQGSLSLQGERAVLTLKGIGSPQLAAWLAEARAGARARVIEGTLNQTAPGLYSGSLTLALGGGPR